MDTTATLVARVNALLDAVEALRIGDVVAAFAADGRLELPNLGGGQPRVMAGEAEIRRFLELFARSIPAIRFVARQWCSGGS